LLLLERGPARDLSRWLHGERPTRRAQLRVARELGRAIAVLHRDGLRPRDLRAENFLLDDALHATLVDLDGIAPRRRRVPALARCARDVARLRASFPPEAPLDAGAVELFARTYAAERGLSAEHLRRWRAIAAARAEELWELWRKRGLRFDAAGIHERA
jgi:tRNA A-37 threonylcarbamoyl transferase component Bud32